MRLKVMPGATMHSILFPIQLLLLKCWDKCDIETYSPLNDSNHLTQTQLETSWFQKAFLFKIRVTKGI